MVKEPAVVDTACLIGLERIGRLDLLTTLVDPVLVPSAVAGEFGSEPEWMNVLPVADKGMVRALGLVVDPGEAEAIALAYEKQLRIILDDRKAREAAHSLGLRVTGTVGLLVLAKRAGIIPAVGTVLDELDRSGFRVSTGLRLEALRLAGENAGNP